MKLKSYRVSLALYLLLSCFISFPYWLRGDVIAPHRQFVELAATDNTGAILLENRKFSDFTNQYIPEISEHLKSKRSSWLTLWAIQNELGRPLYQISGFSPAYLPSWIIAQLTDSPWLFITTLSLLTCFFADVFILLFCREIGLNPLAGLMAGSMHGLLTFFGCSCFYFWH
jgi:hypothetical protein